MMTIDGLTRRGFLGTAIGAAVVAAAAPLPILPDLPTLYGDGIHDDTAGLQAAIDGRAYRQAWDGATVAARELADTVTFPRGEYYLAGTIIIGGWAGLVDGNRVKLRGLGDGLGPLVTILPSSLPVRSLCNFEFWPGDRDAALGMVGGPAFGVAGGGAYG